MLAIPARLKPYIGSRNFYRQALTVMIPVVIQQLINTLFNVVDNVMVGGIGALAMSAVTAANKPYLIYNGFFFGMAGAGGLLISQYYGAKERDTCQGLFALQLVLGLISSLLFGAVMFLLPGPIMEIFLQDPETVQLGVDYMRVVCFSYIPVAISSVCIFSMRSLGLNKMPMVVGLMAMLANACFNYVFIFGLGPVPAMGVVGAALGTLMSRTLEMAFYLVVLARRRAFFSLKLAPIRRLTGSVLRSFACKALPLTFNEILYNLGYNIYFWTYARLDEAAIPAVTIADQAMQIGVVVSVGMASAVSVMIGTELGANCFAQAKSNCKKLLGLVCAISLLCTAIGLCAAFALPYAFDIAVDLRGLATTLTLIYCLFYLPNAVYAFCFYCLRAGGDTRGATLLDSGYMWLVPVPASLLMGWLGVGVIPLTLALTLTTLLMNLKVIPALVVLKRGKWVRNITV